MSLKQTIRPYARAIAYFRDGLPRLAVQIGLMWLGVFFSVISVLPLLVMQDGVFGNIRNGSLFSRLFFHFAPSSIPKQVFALAVILLLCSLAKEVLSMVQTLIGIKVGYQGLMKVRCDLFRKLQE